MILYNVPSRTNLNINPDTLKALSEIENIYGVKECNLLQVADVVNLCGSDFHIYSGNDEHIFPIMAYGGLGVISVMANIIPKDTHNITQMYLNGDIEGSRKLQLKTLNLVKALFIEVNPIPIKAAMNLMGFNVGKPRMPLTEMEPANLERLRKELIKCNIKTVA